VQKESEFLLLNSESKLIRSLSIEKGDLLRLCNLLREINDAAGKIEIESFAQMDLSDEEYKERKRILQESFELRITVVGSDGQELFGTISEVFNSPNFPDQFTSIFISSDTVFSVRYKFQPRNYFHILFDFSKPPVLDMSFLPSVATPNTSSITVRGYNSIWVNGVFHEVNSFINKHPSKFNLIHKNSIYDFSLFIFGFPFGFWIVYRLSGVLNKIFAGISVIVQSASYVYVFLISLFIWRIIFHYARWIWPLVEYQNQKSKSAKHRNILIVICLGITAAVIYDIIKAVFFS